MVDAFGNAGRAGGEHHQLASPGNPGEAGGAPERSSGTAVWGTGAVLETRLQVRMVEQQRRLLSLEQAVEHLRGEVAAERQHVGSQAGESQHGQHEAALVGVEDGHSLARTNPLVLAQPAGPMQRLLVQLGKAQAALTVVQGDTMGVTQGGQFGQEGVAVAASPIGADQPRPVARAELKQARASTGPSGCEPAGATSSSGEGGHC